MTVVVSPRAVDQRAKDGYKMAANSVPPTATTGENGWVRKNVSTQSDTGKNNSMMKTVSKIPAITSKTECMPGKRGGMERIVY